MKSKPLIITVVGLAVAAGLLVWREQERSAAPRQPERVGEPLLDVETLAAAHRIELGGSEDNRTVVFERDNDRWVLPEYHGMPADFSKLSNFTRSLMDASVDRYVSSIDETIQRLNLGQHVIRIAAAEGESIWQLEIGSRASSGGSFIRLTNEPSAYLTSGSIFPDTNQSNWLLRRPLDFNEDDVAGVSIPLPDREEPLRFYRSTPDEGFAADGLAENESVNQSEVGRLIRHILNARFTDVVEAGDTDVLAARNEARSIVLERFDGERFTVSVGRRGAPEEDVSAPTAAPETTDERISTSLVFDQDGRIISEEEIAAIQARGLDVDGVADEDAAPAHAAIEEEIEAAAAPGPVFVFYESSDPDFPWPALMERVALIFPDHFYTQIPKDASALIETKEVIADQPIEDEQAAVLADPVATPVE